MSLIPTIYSSADPGAPVLTGQAGSLTALLDALLLNGYSAGESFKAPLGWTLAYTATNKRVYRNDPVLGTGRYLRVDDSATSGNARHAWVQAFESAISVDEGVAVAPPIDSWPNGGIVVKSNLLSSAARVWWAIGNSKSLYVFFSTLGGDASAAVPYFFGDYDSTVVGDSFNFLVTHSEGITYAGAVGGQGVLFRAGASMEGNLGSGISQSGGFGYSLRSRTGAVGAVRIAHSKGDFFGDVVGNIGYPFPNPLGGGLCLRSMDIRESAAYSLCGRLPGILMPLHARPLEDQQLLFDVDALGGSNLIAKNFATGQPNSSAYAGQVLFRINEEW